MNKKNSFKIIIQTVCSFLGLYKISNGAIVAGVCKGVAKRFNYKVSIVRICWVLSIILSLTLTGFVYFFLAYILPEDNGNNFHNYKTKEDDFIDVDSKEV